MTSATAADGLPPAAPTSNPILATLQRIGRSLMLPIAVMTPASFWAVTDTWSISPTSAD